MSKDENGMVNPWDGWMEIHELGRGGVRWKCARLRLV